MSSRTSKRTVRSTLTVVATAAVLAACGSSGNNGGTQAAAATQAGDGQPSTRASTPTTSTPQQFASKPYGFTVTLPRDWTETDALVDWNGKYIAGPGESSFANFTDPARSRTLMVAAAPVQPDMQLAEWQRAIVAATPGLCTKPTTVQTTTLGGEPALAWTLTCSDGFDVNKLAALHGQRGYVFYLASATANDDTQDQRIFEQIRQTFHFTNTP